MDSKRSTVNDSIVGIGMISISPRIYLALLLSLIVAMKQATKTIQIDDNDDREMERPMR